MNRVPLAKAATALFVPANRPDRFHKAAASGADIVVLDLEDAVPIDDKDRARKAVFHAVTGSGSDFAAAVRINALASGGVDDLSMLSKLASEWPDRLCGILLPKAESVDDVVAVSRRVPLLPLVPLIETVAGLAASETLARGPQVARLAFGALDFSLDLNATSLAVLDFARCEIVVKSRLAGIAAPLDSPNPAFHDAEAVRQGAASARALGFGGQLCIHPLQVPIVAEAFRPTAEEVAWAERVVSAGEGPTQLDGKMIDRPILRRAQSLLARSHD